MRLLRTICLLFMGTLVGTMCSAQTSGYLGPRTVRARLLRSQGRNVPEFLYGRAGLVARANSTTTAGDNLLNAPLHNRDVT